MNPTDLALGVTYFGICAAVALAGALITVFAKNPIRGAMGLLAMVLSVAGLFLALHAQFLAAIQVIVYAGAIVVLFIFVIMLLGPSATASYDARGRGPRVVGAGLFVVAGITAMVLLLRTAPSLPLPKERLLADTPADFGSVERFGAVLFGPALVPFELSSALIMVAVIGAVAVARGRTRKEKELYEAEKTMAEKDVDDKKTALGTVAHSPEVHS